MADYKKKNFKGKRYTRKPSFMEEAPVKKEGNFPFGNDFAWYNKYPELMKDASNIPFNWIPGTPIFEDGTINRPIALVGAVAIDMEDTYGWEGSATGPINMAARNIFLQMHRKYRGLSQYQASDLGIVLIATLELLKLIAQFERIYGVLNYYKVTNQNLPYTMLRALGISDTQANEMRSNLADYRYRFNVLISKAQNVLIPKDMTVINEKLALYSYIYSDDTNADRATALIFRSKSVGTYRAADLKSGGSVLFEQLDNFTFTTLLNKLDQCITALVTDDDVVKIYSDMLAVFGASNTLSVMPIPEGYQVIPQYNESILHKFHNLEVLDQLYAIDVDNYLISHDDKLKLYNLVDIGVKDDPFWRTASGYGKRCIYQSNDIIHTEFSYGPAASVNYNLDTSRVVVDGLYGFKDDGNLKTTFSVRVAHPITILDSLADKIDEGFTVEGCLWKSFGHLKGNKNNFVVRTAALEVCLGVSLFYRGARGIITEVPYHQWMLIDDETSGPDSSFRVDRFAEGLAISHVDWAPFIYTVYCSQLNPYDGFEMQYIKEVVGDVEICTSVDFSKVRRIHEQCCYSAFKCDLQVSA